MPLNYSKWDALELSDDSDIEGHPNVDKRSLVRWKQRDIHEKREIRKARIAQLRAEIACNNVLAPRVSALLTALRAKHADGGEGAAMREWEGNLERLQTRPSDERPPTSAPGQPTYDAMMLSLLLQITEEAKAAKEVAKGDGFDIGAELVKGLEKHETGLGEHTRKLEKELKEEEAEQKKHITSDDIREGWESKYIPAKPEPKPVASVGDTKKTTKTTETTYETLNPVASSSSAPSSSTSPPSATAAATIDGADDLDDLPELTPALAQFARLPLWAYEPSYRYIQAHREVVVPGASDALLVEAFKAEGDGESKYAKQCVHQSLLLQYGEKLGRDGIQVFFRKMMQGDPRAVNVFVKDVEDTFAHLVQRVAASKVEASTEREQIQLVPQDPSQSITFNVPDGPPPEDLRLEGEGVEELDVEEVRKALQMRWDVFSGFPEELQGALTEGTLESVNGVLGEMDVEKAEEVVKLLDLSGIMSFVEGGIRDETGKGEGEDGEA
ncbi:hypothetical protein CONPUDRAFT_123914 [Coniophora puteana RWD-64-598 SS2]|uniref:Hsp90 chaperone protein kinase-targeting subunit n=1 Tax=Coniophora puteana (strain RWD-64-598) TaxID=741705 RepID=A0A5M3MPN7_CONPW|nr:uncharacterized protein CONPUDRAFT_123914 [Coniophora puteana RWD-64-598 SS2]EIW81030.1 hypothetical protein CONPUDRAFT_123914 [Coniophora puteana RWD-64-598 SS2]